MIECLLCSIHFHASECKIKTESTKKSGIQTKNGYEGYYSTGQLLTKLFHIYQLNLRRQNISAKCPVTKPLIQADIACASATSEQSVPA